MTSNKQSLAEPIKGFFNEPTAPIAEDNPLGHLFFVRKILRERALTKERAVKQMLMMSLDRMSESHPLETEVLRARIGGDRIMDTLASDFNVSVSHLYRVQKKAHDTLADTVQAAEKQAILDQQAILYARLEVSNNEQLIGVEDSITHLMKQIQEPESPWIVFIEGIGGIGKTSLAGALCRRVIEQFLYDEVGWVSASHSLFTLGGGADQTSAAMTAQNIVDDITQQLIPELAYERLSYEERLERLHARLNEIPHLIVVDNLETLEDVEMLLPTIQRLANPTKFVLTSRKYPVTNAAIHSFVVSPLSEEDTMALLYQEAMGSNLLQLDEQREALFQGIYRTVGGNPLALRLVIGQARFYSIGDIYIADVSGIRTGELRAALHKLGSLNLIQIDNTDPHEYLYHIHSLTRTFLQNQVGGWW